MPGSDFPRPAAASVVATVEAHTPTKALTRTLQPHESIHRITHPVLGAPILAKRVDEEVETGHPHVTALRFTMHEIDDSGTHTGLSVQPWVHTISDEAAAYYLTQHPDGDPYAEAIQHVTQEIANKLLHAKLAAGHKRKLVTARVPLVQTAPAPIVHTVLPGPPEPPEPPVPESDPAEP